MGKPFQPVERLPVPPEVHEAFTTLNKANKGYGLSSHRYVSAPNSPARMAAQKASDRVAQAEISAAGHFGGDATKMMTHFKRWLRWGGRAMSAADMFLPKQSMDEGMANADAIVHPAKRFAPRRRPSI